MSTVHVNVKIDAPPRQVWDVVMDPERLGDWVTIHRGVKKVSDRPLKTGATMEQTLHMRGVSFHVHWEVINVREPHVAEWAGLGPARSRARIRYELTGDEDGPTEFEYTNEFQAPGGRLGSVASRVVVGAASEREANNSLQRLKKLLERG